MKGIQKAILPILAGLCLISMIVMIVVLCLPRENKAPFVPPAFESSATEGTPKAPENLGWQELHQEGMPFKVGMCGKVLIQDNKADLYFTNTKTNEVWMKLRIFDSKGNVVAETGLIKPGEYLKTVSFTKTLTHGETLRLKVMTYEPETYYSAGSITLNTNAIIGG